jgi:hypothetical protein
MEDMHFTSPFPHLLFQFLTRQLFGATHVISSLPVVSEMQNFERY